MVRHEPAESCRLMRWTAGASSHVRPASATRQYDLIAVDAYRPPYIPFHLTTVEFFALARDRLAPRRRGGGQRRPHAHRLQSGRCGRRDDASRLPIRVYLDLPDGGTAPLGNSLVVWSPDRQYHDAGRLQRQPAAFQWRPARPRLPSIAPAPRVAAPPARHTRLHRRPRAGRAGRPRAGVPVHARAGE